MLLLQQIKLTNFLSHSSTTINFEKNCKIIITGPSGSGKSGIVDSIIFALYGVGRVANRDLIKKNKKITKVELTLVDDNLTYKIDRTVDNKGKNELNIHEKIKDGNFKPIKMIGLREKQEHLEKEILHSSYILFVNSIIYPQNSVDSFVQQSAVNRKNILLEIINADSFDNYLKLAKEKLSELIQDKSNNDSIVSTINQSLSEDKLLTIELPALEAEEQIKKTEIDTTNKLLKDLATQLAEINFKEKTKLEKGKELTTLNNIILPTIRTEIQTLSSKIKELEELDIAKLQAGVADLGTLNIQLQSFKTTEQLANEWNVKMMEIIKTKPLARNFDNEIAEINKQLITLLNQPTETCPKCGFVLLNLYKDSNIKRLQEELITRNQDKVEYVKAEELYFKKIENLGPQPLVDRNKISELELTINIKEKRKAEIDVIIKNREWDIRVREGKIEDKKKEIGEKEGVVLKLTEEIKVLEVEITGAEAVKKEEASLVSNKTVLENFYNILIGKLSVANEALKRVMINEEKVKLLVEENDKLTENIELLELLRGAFSPNGIKSIVVDYVIPMLEEKINEVLSKLSNFKVHLNTQRETVKGDSVIEGLFIDIENDMGELMSWEAYSGGERVKVNVAIFEGLASISKFGFRIFDETFLGLDEETTSSFGEIMLKLKENVSQLICISHLPQIQEIFEEKIEVVKINGTSQIK